MTVAGGRGCTGRHARTRQHAFTPSPARLSRRRRVPLSRSQNLNLPVNARGTRAALTEWVFSQTRMIRLTDRRGPR